MKILQCEENKFKVHQIYFQNVLKVVVFSKQVHYYYYY